MESFRGGEELFALPLTSYPDLTQTEKELQLSDQLFALYVDVLSTLTEWKGVLWTDVARSIGDMGDKIESFSVRCKKMPTRLRDYAAYKALKTQIEDFQVVLPLLQEMTKESIRPRHWEEVMVITKSQFDFQGPDFSLQSLLNIGLVAKKDEIEEVTDGADKQLKIEKVLEEIEDHWKQARFGFKEWKGRGVQILAGTGAVVEELEEAMMNLQAMLTMRHVAPFRERAQEVLNTLSETSGIFKLSNQNESIDIIYCSTVTVISVQ